VSERSAAASPHHAVTLAKHPPRAGERVLDVGCGSFRTTFELARLVGPKGMVVGLDGCAASSGVAVREARANAPANASVAHGDVCSYRFEHTFDRAFARLMTSCFGDPRPALMSLRTALRPGGWLVMLTYVPEEPGACGPSPFASADREIVRAIVVSAGYRDVAIDTTIAPRGIGVPPQAWCLTARSPL
jgi:SAM-dependent methyltransferase